ncbi:hypothetical protein DMUE_5282 [Dictyocoela muelleri]|nr:hypothetical protein DMUE_5282 [Dictyocoela muelleri]
MTFSKDEEKLQIKYLRNMRHKKRKSEEKDKDILGDNVKNFGIMVDASDISSSGINNDINTETQSMLKKCFDFRYADSKKLPTNLSEIFGKILEKNAGKKLYKFICIRCGYDNELLTNNVDYKMCDVCGVFYDEEYARILYLVIDELRYRNLQLNMLIDQTKFLVTNVSELTFH